MVAFLCLHISMLSEILQLIDSCTLKIFLHVVRIENTAVAICCIKVLLISVLSSCNCLKFNLIGMLQFDDIDALLLIHFAILKKSDCCEFEVLAVIACWHMCDDHISL